MKTLQEAYEILKANARYSSADCEGFVYLSQIEELLGKPKYNQELIEKIKNREIVIEVDGFEGIKDLINYIYLDDPFLVDDFLHLRTHYFTQRKMVEGKYFWASNTGTDEVMEDKPRVKAIDFLKK